MNLPIRRNRGPSKAPTKLARKAIADFVESNIPRFDGWLNQIADGIPQYDGEGEPIRDNKGSLVWLVKPDPALAMKLVADVAEYHLPKLSRAEMQVVAQVESGVTLDLATRVKSMSTQELKVMLAANMAAQGLTWDNPFDGELEDPLAPVDVEARQMPDAPDVPEWMRSDPEKG